MPDIALRIHRDMLVLSSPIEAVLARQGVNVKKDMGYLLLFEPETVQDVLRLEQASGVQCLIAPTAGLTPARLAHYRMRDDAATLAQAACKAVREAKPQHMLVEIGPCGLPLDGSSKASLNEHRDQYARTSRLFANETFDAYFFNGFTSTTDLKCALMGNAQVDDVFVFASVVVDAHGMLMNVPEIITSTNKASKNSSDSADHVWRDNSESLEDALTVMNEYGAGVVGFETDAPLEEVLLLVERARAVSDRALLVQIRVREHAPRQGEPTKENPYYHPDVMVDVAYRLHQAGVQFIRASGQATPAYAAALAATVSGLDVR